jgi:predicted O-linked N-acetylglucosamine transferase (SPINDLY family)
MPDALAERLIPDRAAAPDLVAVPTIELPELIQRATDASALGQKSQAVDLYCGWIAAHPEHPLLYAAHFNHAVVLGELGDLVGATEALRETIRLKPDFCPSYINLGSLYERLGQPERAAGEWMALVNQHPTVTGETIVHKTMALKQLGRILEAAGNDATAEDVLTRSLDIDPRQPDVIQHLVALRQRQCKWPVVGPLPRLSEKELTAEISPISAACLTDDPLLQLAAAYRYNRNAVGIPARSELVAAAPPRTRRSHRLRVGYVSSDLRAHAVGFALSEVLELHDRDQFEVYAYYCGIRSEDQTQQRIKQAVDHWTDLTDRSDREAAQVIAADAIDILVDLNGYTKDARTRIFALRPAPINVNWFGFPGTMGSPYHHYIIADPYIIPESHERYYSERVLRLPCYQPNDRRRPIAADWPRREDAGLPPDAIVYCCLNGAQKLNQPTFERWTRVLREVPNSVLWLLIGAEDTRQRLRERAIKQGVAAERLVFATGLANPEHLARYPLADLVLDTMPYGAHTSASDALWMGVPVLTLSGRSFASRVCGSLVRAAGLDELVTDIPEDYVRLAIELGHDRARLTQLKERLIAGRDRSVLFDEPLLVRKLEDLYHGMWQDYAAGRLPRADLRNLEIYHEIGLTDALDIAATLTDEDYLERYRRRLEDRDAVTPLAADIRLRQE